MIGILFLGIAIGAYAGWGLTLYWTHRDDGDDGGIDVPDYVPDDLLVRR